MALPANLSENGFSAYLIPFNYLDTQGSGHTPQAAPPSLRKHALFAPHPPLLMNYGSLAARRGVIIPPALS